MEGVRMLAYALPRSKGQIYFQQINLSLFCHPPFFRVNF